MLSSYPLKLLKAIKKTWQGCLGNETDKIKIDFYSTFNESDFVRFAKSTSK